MNSCGYGQVEMMLRKLKFQHLLSSGLKITKEATVAKDLDKALQTAKANSACLLACVGVMSRRQLV